MIPHPYPIITFQGSGPYTDKVKDTEDDIAARMKKVNELAGIKESDTGLALPALWDIQADKQALQTEEPLQVSGCGREGWVWHGGVGVAWRGGCGSSEL